MWSCGTMQDGNMAKDKTIPAFRRKGPSPTALNALSRRGVALSGRASVEGRGKGGLSRNTPEIASQSSESIVYLLMK